MNGCCKIPIYIKVYQNFIPAKSTTPKYQTIEIKGKLYELERETYEQIQPIYCPYCGTKLREGKRGTTAIHIEK